MKISLVCFVLTFLIHATVFACTPCRDMFDLDKTMSHSDIIILGKLVALGPDTGDPNNSSGGPDWIDVKVLNPLKGEIKTDQVIRVNSFSGMCDYGIQPFEGKKILFLNETKDEVHQYSPVNYGCAVKSLNYENDKIKINDQFFSLEEFKDSKCTL